MPFASKDWLLMNSVWLEFCRSLNSRHVVCKHLNIWIFHFQIFSPNMIMYSWEYSSIIVLLNLSYIFTPFFCSDNTFCVCTHMSFVVLCTCGTRCREMRTFIFLLQKVKGKQSDQTMDVKLQFRCSIFLF